MAASHTHLYCVSATSTESGMGRREKKEGGLAGEKGGQKTGRKDRRKKMGRNMARWTENREETMKDRGRLRRKERKMKEDL